MYIIFLVIPTIKNYCFSILMIIGLNCVDKNYECEDGHALITDNSWVLLCPPNEEIVSRSPSVLNRIPTLLPATRVGEYSCKENTVYPKVIFTIKL